MNKRLLRFDEVANIFGIKSVTTIHNWVNQGIIKKVKIGGKVFISREDVEQLIDKKIKESEEEG